MGRKVIYYSAILIGTYLVVANATNAGKLLTNASSAASGYAKTLQGR